MDFGFNRRSRGPENRPRLLLYTGTQDPTGETCDPNAPAPAISEIGIHDGLQTGSVTVSWRTDNVDSDSFVLFREQGETAWTQVGSLARTRVHQVQVFGLDPGTEYEFAVRSRALQRRDDDGRERRRGLRLLPASARSGASHPARLVQLRDGRRGLDGRPTPARQRQRRVDAGSPGPCVGERLARLAVLRLERDDADLAGRHLQRRAGGGRVLRRARHRGGLRLPPRRVLDERLDVDDRGVDHGTNAAYPDYEAKDVRFRNPGGPMIVRFRFKSDDLISSPAYMGVSVDEVKFASYPNAPRRRTICR